LGIKLALITNGAAEPQRAKVVRFALEHRFDHIQIEGEHGFGKPEERAYNHAMEVLGVGPHETWMVGDNLEWEIMAPQRLGIHAIWHDGYGVACPRLPDPPRPHHPSLVGIAAVAEPPGVPAAAALLWLFAATAASGQTNPSAYDPVAVVQAICRQYAAAQTGMPYDTMYAQCMYARGYRVPGFSPTPNSPGYQGELPGPAAHNGGA
jgi:hypothetical protein